MKASFTFEVSNTLLLIYFYLSFHGHVWFYRDRKRDKAKQCTIYSWRTHCNYSDVADGILKKVIGSFNPFCDGDKDPLAEQTDQCAKYSKPLDDESCPLPSKQPCPSLLGLSCAFFTWTISLQCPPPPPFFPSSW